jgi:formylglycine-generating enzyme required for sulfatase activity
MHGNVWEWCADWYENPYRSTAVTDPTGPAGGTSRVLRGGTWSDAPNGVRSAYRNCIGPDDATEGTGLRCVLTVREADAAGVR